MKEKPSFLVRRAAKEHTCLYCGKTIPKGTKYYVKTETPKELRKALEQRTGWSVYTIKARTRFWYIDKVNWPFCSLECLAMYCNTERDKLPQEVQERIQQKIKSIVDNVSEIVSVIVALGGSKPYERDKFISLLQVKGGDDWYGRSVWIAREGSTSRQGV